MHPTDPYRAHDDEPGDMPRLPLARPGEARPTPPSSTDSGVAPRPLGGGASFTSVDADAPRSELADGRVSDLDAMTWDAAARLTSGLLANPSRSHASVKDAMALFDQFLNEMHAYVKIADVSGMSRSNAERRQAHQEYFRGTSDEPAAASTEPPTPAGPVPPTARPAKPAPSKPRPSSDYRPIPPGLRGPYAPGSMAGSPPPDDEHGEPVRRHPAA